MPNTPATTPPRPTPPWRAVVLTLFPGMFPGPLGVSLVGTALKAGRWTLEPRDIRDHGIGRHRSVDDTPAGGGAGMVLRCDVAAAAIDAAVSEGAGDLPRVYLSPRGRPFDQTLAREWAAGPGVLMLAGRFEGLDERVIEARDLEEVSLGDFVLSGGEIAAMAMIDACVRLLPGVLGADQSLAEESFESGRLEYPHYTRPREWEDRAIPDVLLGGDHGRIADWRRAQSDRLTQARRPDLLEKQKR